jgi:hypothetical protein
MFLATGSESAQAALTYGLTICGDAAGCTVEQANVAPPAESLDGIDAALAAYYAPLNPAGPLSYSIQGANSSGLVFGPVSDNVALNTFFVYNHGTVECCVTDDPFNIAGLNESGTFIVNYPAGRSFIPHVTSDLSALETPTEPVNLNAESQALLEETFANWTEFFANNTFSAIDNDGRISGQSVLGAYMLTPESVEVPEPGSLPLLAAAAAMLAFYKRSSRPTA